MNIFKSIFTVVLVIIGVGFQPANAQEPDAKITVTKVINVSSDQVWTILRKMDDIQKYSSYVDKVIWTGDHGIGGSRKCLPPEGHEGYYVEQIVDFNDSERTYSYAVVEGVPVKGMVNSFKVVDLGYKKSMIVWTSTYEQFMENPQMDEVQFKGFLTQASNEMITKVSAAAGNI
ncbi:MAG: SRPBCC family protein [Leptolyngbya sp. SIO1D8]|nr:SRPBCC family protein [Leptolyngbya sp. SIO1D8]